MMHKCQYCETLVNVDDTPHPKPFNPETGDEVCCSFECLTKHAPEIAKLTAWMYED